MKVHIFTRFPRLKEVTGIVLLLASVGFLFALASYQPSDPSWNNATWRHPPLNKIGVVGAHLSDLCFQVFGLTAWVLPFLMGYKGAAEFKEQLQLNENSRVLLINTEGNTDPDYFRNVVWEGVFPVPKAYRWHPEMDYGGGVDANRPLVRALTSGRAGL